MGLRCTPLVLLAVTLLGLTGFAIAGPDIPKGNAEQCVEDTDFMRRNHMDMLKHQRDETVIDGIRKKQFNLTECISCHAVEGSDGKAVTVSSPEHFCRSCHDYAAVKVDCFQCHASRPEDGDMPEGHQLGNTFPTSPLVNGSK